jgi:hypothetical protein
MIYSFFVKPTVQGPVSDVSSTSDLWLSHVLNQNVLDASVHPPTSKTSFVEYFSAS